VHDFGTQRDQMTLVSAGGSLITDKNPILFLDINFGNNQISRIVLFEGDKPGLVVQKFANAHGKLSYLFKISLKQVLMIRNVKN